MWALVEWSHVNSEYLDWFVGKEFTWNPVTFLLITDDVELMVGLDCDCFWLGFRVEVDGVVGFGDFVLEVVGEGDCSLEEGMTGRTALEFEDEG